MKSKKDMTPEERQELRKQAADRRRAEKDAVQAAELESIAKDDAAAFEQRKLAKQLSTAVVGEEEKLTHTGAVPALSETSEDHQVVTRPRGRPSEYTDEEADRICAWIAEGRSMRSYCRLEHRSLESVYRWLREHRDFRERYARAHDDRADSLADEITDIADEVADADMAAVQAARLRVDARKWVASKLKPTKWGDYQADTAKTNITFNIGIRDPHTNAPTIIDNPLKRLGNGADN